MTTPRPRAPRSISRSLFAATLLAGLCAAHAAPATAELRAEVPEPARRVFMMTDSVGLGVRGVLQATLPEYQVVIDGYPALMVDQLEDRMLMPRVQSQSTDLGETAVVAAGYNYRYWDPAGFDADIDSMMATLRSGGVKHVIWVTLREIKQELVSASAWRQIQPYYFYFPTVNDHLRRAVARHPDLVLADWASISDQPGVTYDAIHLTASGAALYSTMIANLVRTTTNWRAPGTTSKVKVAGLNGVATDASAVAVNLTVTTPRAQGFLTAWACGTPQPATSNLNFMSDQTVAVSAIVNVGSDGEICVFNSVETQIIVDVQGYFAPGSSYRTVAPARLVDTRTQGPSTLHPAGEPLVVRVVDTAGIEAGSAGVAVNVTIVDNSTAGFALVYPCDTPQAVPIALVNYIAHTATPNFGIVKPAADGTICIRTSSPASIIVDAFGYFPAGSPISVTAPTRLVDTRPGGARLDVLTDIAIPVIGVSGLPTNAMAAVVMVTAASPVGVGWVVAYPCGTGSATSTLNVVPGRATTNTAIVSPGAGGTICVKANIATHILVDVSAWIIDGYVGLTPWRAFDSRTL
ncbi:MAG: hypothetical protein ABIW84_05715 [Ilumatobacteraceae bacterium]